MICKVAARFQDLGRSRMWLAWSKPVSGIWLARSAGRCMPVTSYKVRAITAMLAANGQYQLAALLPAAHAVGDRLLGRRHRRVGSRQSSGGGWSLAANGNRAAGCGIPQKCK